MSDNKDLISISYIVTRADHYGGAQIHIRDLSKDMKDKGHKVHVISGTDGVLGDIIRKNNIHFYCEPWLVRSLHPIKDIIAFFKIRKKLKAINPDLVSCHSSKAGIIGRLAAYSLGIPVIFTAHGWSFTDGISLYKRILYLYIEKICARFCNHIITVCNYDKYLALNSNVGEPDQITTIHNGKTLLSASAPNTNETPQLCMVARFCEQKDHISLLNALSLLKDKKWHLNLVGGGDDRYARAITKSHKIENRVTFHGQRDDIETFLPTQDIFILASHWEGFPRSIIAAMRASLPVITTRTAGSPEAVTHLKTGYVVPEGNVKAIARAINILTASPDRCLKMGLAGRKRFEKYFTLDIMVEKTLKIYQTVLETTQIKQIERQAHHSRKVETQ